MKLETFLGLVLLHAVLKTRNAQAYTISTKADYIFGEVMQIFFMYEQSFEQKSAVESVLSIIENVTVLHSCTIPPVRGREISKHQGMLPSFVRPSSQDKYFQIIELTTDFIDGFRTSNTTPWNLKVTMETKDNQYYTYRYFDLVDAIVGDWLFDTLIWTHTGLSSCRFRLTKPIQVLA
ncbi:hypothetical protein ElyMa_002437400 [Elysia marginata]|uniref:Secreted protein n=1 Tax=Elysia marginata TaxID=1093978 RepID=A0AAV4GIY2_9GAST|nr:hypothetical protein ElyMa_002437400 [Elysia marginata]